MTCTNTETAERALEKLRGLEDNLEQFDQIDQVEILYANAQFSYEDQLLRRPRIEEKVKGLPPAAVSQIKALGMRIS
jgi:hypothetical protein